MALTSTTLSTHQEAQRRACGIRTGTRTAADFTINLGFTPICVIVRNLTDRVEAIMWLASALDGGSNAKGIKVVAAGTKTYVDVGITMTADNRGFTCDVSVAGLETDDDDVYWEAWS